MRRYGFALVVAILAAGGARANDLDQLYQAALTHDATLQTAIFQRDAAIEARPQALAALLPQIIASASGQRESLSAQLEQPVATVGGIIPGCEAPLGAQTETCQGDAHGYGLTLSQTVWSFQSFSQLREANSLVASAEATLLSAQQNLVLRVAQAYFGILSARDQLTNAKFARSSYATSLDQAKGRLQTGVGPRADVEQAQSYYDSTEQSVIDAQNAVDDAELLMTEIAGTSATDVAALRDNIPLQSPDPASVEAWVTSALQDNPAVRAAMLQSEAAHRDIDVQRGRGLPTLTASGSRTHTWQDLPLGGDQADESIGLSVNWPLFQGGAVASAVRQSRALYREATAQYENARRDTERLTRSAYRDVVTGIARIAAARRFMDSAHDAVDASRRNVEFSEAGTGAEFQLLNTQSIYYGAQAQYDQTRYDYLTALLTLKQQAGRLSENDLATIDALLVSHGP